MRTIIGVLREYAGVRRCLPRDDDDQRQNTVLYDRIIIIGYYILYETAANTSCTYAEKKRNGCTPHQRFLPVQHVRDRRADKMVGTEGAVIFWNSDGCCMPREIILLFSYTSVIVYRVSEKNAPTINFN